MQHCDHAGSVWQIDVINCSTGPCPCGWECTRCGRRWQHDPAAAGPGAALTLL